MNEFLMRPSLSNQLKEKKEIDFYQNHQISIVCARMDLNGVSTTKRSKIFEDLYIKILPFEH